MTVRDARPFDGGRALQRIGLAVGAAGAAFTAVSFAVDARQAFFSYLIAWSYALSTALGALVLLLICHAMNAGWPVALRRPVEAMVDTLPLLAVLALPLYFGLGELYPFMHPERVADPATRALLFHKRAWLNQPFFVARGVFYLSAWAALTLGLRRLSQALDQPGHAAAKPALKMLSSAALPPLGLTITFASFDWVMALSPDWYSTMFGVYYFAGGFLAAIACVVLLLAAAQSGGWLSQLGRSHYYALGRLLLAFVIFWAYVAYFQFFLTWIANKPIEARWYLDRLRGDYRAVAWFLLAGHFALPFFVLLSYRVKQSARGLAPIAAWIAAVHYFDVHWLIAPARHAPRAFSFIDLAALAAIGGLTVAFGVWRQRGRPIAPIGDPDYQRSLEYESA